ncbi:polysaccharide biosynthesis/export family protein [Pseudotabrizicola alkalilacus]|uniref:Polysaccharide export protein N-terminal domain-containing protein n=1 Tax=Pseudotabrizicola alkalilacus TaxID=2305252 RepID=A0A411YZT8_9RHOB|nr:polysaccharide biosynthesis/export family protein [Pseudotabrizicola alkalilacus]RGP36331.1 hypothetical protein D1012_16260 [Pseudotabrizicola alkalilacus]
MRYLTAILALCSVLLAGAAQAQEQMPRLAPGDVLTIRVARLPELDRDAMIGPDGTIRIAGRAVAVSGMDLDAAHNAIVTAVKQETGAAPPFVLVDVLEWRPVAIYGAGVRSGDVPWRPDMTVRRAVATVDSRLRDDDSPQLIEVLEGQRAATRILDETDRLARALVQISILKAELDDGAALADAGADELDPAVLDRIRVIEAEVHALRRERLAQQRENLASQRLAVTRQIDSMAEELDLQRRRVGLFEEQLVTAETLTARGLSTQDRVSNRQADLMNAQLLVVRLISERAEAESRQILIDSLINELGTSWTLDLTTELNTAQATAISARNALALARQDLAASEQILGAVSLEPAKTAYAIHRKAETGVVALAAEADTAVQPGDIIQVIRK